MLVPQALGTPKTLQIQGRKAVAIFSEHGAGTPELHPSSLHCLQHAALLHIQAKIFELLAQIVGKIVLFCFFLFLGTRRIGGKKRSAYILLILYFGISFFQNE